MNEQQLEQSVTDLLKEMNKKLGELILLLKDDFTTTVNLDSPSIDCDKLLENVNKVETTETPTSFKDAAKQNSESYEQMLTTRKFFVNVSNNVLVNPRSFKKGVPIVGCYEFNLITHLPDRDDRAS